MKWSCKIFALLCMAAMCAKAEETRTTRVGQHTYTYRVVYRVMNGSAVIGSTRKASVVPPPRGEYAIPSRLGGFPVVIGDSAFMDCPDLTSVFIPRDVTIDEGFAQQGVRMFASSEKLTRFVVAEDHPNYVSLDGVLFDKDMTTLIRFPPGKDGKDGKYAIPEGIVTIGGYAFEGCKELTSLTLPSSLTEIRGGARTLRYARNLSSVFVVSGNTAYTSVDGVLFDKEKTTLVMFPDRKIEHYVIPDGIQVIGSRAFVSSGLHSVVIPESVTTIEDVAFGGSYLTSITIPKNVTSIGALAFGECMNLATVNLKCAKPQKEAERVFDGTSVTRLIVPRDMGWKSGERYWGKFVVVR